MCVCVYVCDKNCVCVCVCVWQECVCVMCVCVTRMYVCETRGCVCVCNKSVDVAVNIYVHLRKHCLGYLVCQLVCIFFCCIQNFCTSSTKCFYFHWPVYFVFSSTDFCLCVERKQLVVKLLELLGVSAQASPDWPTVFLFQSGRLFVRNLYYQCSEEDLRAMFAEYGTFTCSDLCWVTTCRLPWIFAMLSVSLVGCLYCKEAVRCGAGRSQHKSFVKFCFCVCVAISGRPD